MTILDRDVVIISGAETFSFLQSLVSQDVDGLADGAVVTSLLLTPKGKIDSWFRLVRVGDTAWLDCEAGFGDALRTSLERFKLRVKVEISSPATPWGMVASRGVAIADVAVPAGCRALPVDWSSGAGVDVIGPRAELVRLEPLGLDADAYEQARIAAGIPRLGLDLDESTIPQEAWLDRDSVSFTKGCFLGQELVARIDSRGHVNRQLRRIRSRDGALVLARDAEVEVDGKVVGKITSAVPGLALGYIRHEVVPPAGATVSGASTVIEALPNR